MINIQAGNCDKLLETIQTVHSALSLYSVCLPACNAVLFS